jgi:hypothetical protein
MIEDLDDLDELEEQLAESRMNMQQRVTQKAWNEIVQLRPELRSGELAMNTFAADLQDVAMGEGRPMYKNVSEFFAFTYPTFNLRELAKDVIWRLAGRNDKAIRQLTLTYGGGKTHTLVTLFHLVNEPDKLPDLPTVHEFLNHIQIALPQTRIAVLAFDKIDDKSGREVIGPRGKRRWLRHPWSLLAYQLADEEGLRILNREEDGAERDTPPAENLLVELLSVPRREEGKAVLILMDEVLMYARVKVERYPEWRGLLNAFFQYLTQAVEKVDGCALVASLLATKPEMSDELGRGLLLEYSNIFRRVQEESIEPVGKEDIAEVMRRRFFTLESIRDRTEFAVQAKAAVQDIAELDEQTRKDLRAQETRFVQSYPFHPDLTDLFYTKWTQLSSFQRTRGILRIFALALKDAETWDTNPLIAANVFLGDPHQSGLGDAARELTDIAEKDETEGQQSWQAILVGELEKAKAIQNEFAALSEHREIEQAVFATFLHSQPLRAQSEAKTRELLALVGQTHPHRIDMENALRLWAERSWFLDEKNLDASRLNEGKLPVAWRLGLRPNLKQVHHTACERVTERDIESRLLKEIETCRSLYSDLPAGVKHHVLPESPRAIEDDGEFHYAVLGPDAACRPGAPSAKARRLLEQKTGPDNPRVNRNAVILAVPSFEGLAAAQNAVKQLLGWLQVEDILKGTEIDSTRKARLADEKRDANRRMLDAVRLQYNVFVTLTDEGDKGEIRAFHVVSTNGDSLFTAIKKNEHARIQETPVTAEALLPDGPYDLWKKGDTARPFRHLVEAFAQVAQLPKMLNRKAIEDTLLRGGKNGLFVFRLTRPDKSFQTFWREAPDDVALKDIGLEVVLPEVATLSSLSTVLLAPNALPGLWQGDTLPLRELYAYFADGRRVKETPEGYTYEVEITIPRADRDVLNRAVREAVKEKRLWLLAGRGSFLGEDVPEGILTEDAYLTLPPRGLSVDEILPQQLPEAWQDGETTAWAIAEALATKKGKPLPWSIVRTVIDGAILARLIETTVDSRWPCSYADARQAKIRLRQDKAGKAGDTSESEPESPTKPPPKVREQSPQSWSAGAYLALNEMQDLQDQLGEIERLAVGQKLELYVRIELSGKDNQPVPTETVEKINALLSEVSEQLKLQ